MGMNTTNGPAMATATKADAPTPPVRVDQSWTELRAPSHDELTVIRPMGGWKFVDFRELWNYRGLIFNFIWRDIKVRYKHTILGIGWAVVQPLMMMIVFTTYFSAIRVGGAVTMPYSLFVYSGILPWFFFSSATVAAGNSIVHSEHLITKIYFPRMVATVASAGVYVVDFIIAFCVLLGLIFVYVARGAENVAIQTSILLVPLVLAMFAFAALSIGILLAALNVTYRDFRLVIPFALQMWFFTTPVIFLEPPPPATSTAVPKQIAASLSPGTEPGKIWTEEVNQDLTRTRNRHEFLMYTNPLCSLIVTFRATVLGGAVPWQPLGVSMGLLAVVFVIGSVYFHRVEDRFADII
jgi:lipopolysaccharide transport system permease protein